MVSPSVDTTRPATTVAEQLHTEQSPFRTLPLGHSLAQSATATLFFERTQHRYVGIEATENTFLDALHQSEVLHLRHIKLQSLRCN